MRIVEVGPRDGLQNEQTPIPTELKTAFVRGLVASGLHEIEVTSFVSPKWVPQLADAEEVLAAPRPPTAWVLVPNRKGLERALALGVDHIALFTAASDAFTQRNVNMTVAETLDAFAEVIAGHRAAFPTGRIRGYVSTSFECPYAGRIAPTQVVPVVEALLGLGVDEVSLGDTIGVAGPTEVRRLASALSAIPKTKVAWHFHDTSGRAIANVAAAMELGYEVFDASAGGLGGCPYAPGAGGNLATDDLVSFLEREGIATGMDPLALARASLPILEHLGRTPTAKAQRAVLAADALRRTPPPQP